MYPHFIELHNVKGSMLMLNIDQIVCVVKSTVVTTSPMIMYEVTETYDEIRELMRKAGTQIDKWDPRIDQKEPLTFEDLKDMTGEPVWNSNLREWMIVEGIGPDEDPDRETIRLQAGGNVHWFYDRETLAAKPLYRMKHEAA